jgi:cytidyltransferase-like protein
MTHLYQDVSKKGMSFLDTLFSKPLTISEKIDGTALICKKTKSGIIFFGREGTKRIDKIARMFSTMYEPGITHLKKQDLSFLRDDEELHFEYFSPKVNHIVKYEDIPENGLVLLSSTTKRNINMIAHDLGVLPPPVIFKGKLDDTQIEELKKFLIMSPELRQIKFKTNSFTTFIISLLNSSYKPTLGSENIEGIVISTSDGNYSSKIVDPLFTDTIMSKKDNDKVKAEYYKDISKLVTDLDLSSAETYKSDETEPEERYIDFLMHIIIDNISELMGKKPQFEKYDFGTPYIVTYTDFNYKMFPKVVVNIMKENPWFKDFARLVFSNYSKEKGRATKNFTKDEVQIINDKIKLIKKYVLLDKDVNVSESEILIEDEIKTYGVMFGRFQPLTLGHMRGIDQMSKDVDKGTVYIVKGEKSSKDKDKNPFSTETQLKLLKAVLPNNIDAQISKTAFYPDIINEIDATDFKIYAGTDRYQSYKKMLTYVDDSKSAEIIQIKRSDDDISATKVRNALKDNDEKTFKELTPNRIHIFYNELRKEILEA